MADLSLSSMLWYIYRRNQKAGGLTTITMLEFCKEFPLSTYADIEKMLKNLIETMNFVCQKASCMYDLTELGLTEIEKIMR